ncbi:hypothetical protein D9757_011081 [Collybiopsis confluens]|uniref:Cytochrome P450 n=1 Tax=Collybiopsis confluens TaxID=2823264 RepID=A0A8H5GQD4_9AGAR|nr:hypothetical protein D9757_011081 [Collybiopsis confluens]
MAANTLLAIALSGLLIVYKLYSTGQREKGLPPGPPTRPVFGNALDLPNEHVAIKFTDWAKEYGGIYSSPDLLLMTDTNVSILKLKIAHNTAIVISDMTVVKELMDMHAAETADRSQVYIGEIVTDGFHMALAPYASDVWKISKKALQSFLSPQAVDFYKHIQRATFSFTTSVVFGRRCPSYQSNDLHEFFESVRLWMKLASSETPPVDLFPILKYVPEKWASWKSLAKQIRTMQHKIYSRMLHQCEQLANDESEDFSSFIEQHLGGVCLEAGSETTSALVLLVLHCLVAFPKEQRRCQEEIDRVVGLGRSPVISDYANLPYIQAFVKEVHRFRPVAPLNMPHSTTTDIAGECCIIQARVNLEAIFELMVLNIILDSFYHPEEFLPGRYLESEYGTKPGANGQDFRHSLPFGSGKRLCPGMNLATTSASLHIMNLIWAFDFSTPIDPITGEPKAVNLGLESYNPYEQHLYDEDIEKSNSDSP